MKGNACCAFAGAAIVLATNLFILAASAESKDDWVKCLSALQIPPGERIARCKAALETGSEAWINTSRAYFNRGRAYMDNRDFGHAISDFSQVIHLYPEATYGYAARAAAYFWHHDFDRAIADYARLIELDPRDRLAFMYRGQTYEAMGNLDQSIVEYSRALEIDPKFRTPDIAHFFA